LRRGHLGYNSRKHNSRLRPLATITLSNCFHAFYILAWFRCAGSKGKAAFVLSYAVTQAEPDLFSRSFGGTPLRRTRYWTQGRVDVIKVLARRGADLDAPAQAARGGCGEGYRALHAAVHAGKCDAIDALLELGADVNCADNFGVTPLMLACRVPEARYRLRMAKQLVGGGANPALVCKQGAMALTYAAGLGDVELIKTLVSWAPATLNHVQITPVGVGFTPLSTATANNREDAVRALLSLGASDRAMFEAQRESSIIFAADARLENMVKIFLREGLEAVGGLPAVSQVMCEVVRSGDARILRLLIGVEGEGKEQRWARQVVQGVPMLHGAAAFGSLAVVKALLAAGADETSVDSHGLRAGDVIGSRTPDEDRDQSKETAIRRVLRQGPAFRARSWVWPTRAGGAGGDRDDSKGPAKRPGALPGGARVYRPTATRVFMTRVARYVP